MPTKINGSTGIDKIQDGVVSETKLDNILDGKVEQSGFPSNVTYPEKP